MIKLQHLSKSYGNSLILNSINYEFTDGKIIGIVGENGAGKTTLFRCIAGLESYEGKVISDQTPLKNHLGFLAAETHFFSRITGKEFLRLLSKARNIDSIDFDQNNIFDLPLNQYASTYSTGMKKKLALTAILLQKNQFFILDEPFNGLDIQSNLVVIELLKKLKEKGKTVLISSHIFSTLRETCDEIILLKKGKEIKTVFPNEYDQLEQEMKEISIGDKIEFLNLL